MLREVVQLLLYALLAAFSPLALAATMTAIQAGRRQALGLAVGFVAGQLVTTALFVILNFAAVGSTKRAYPGLRAALALALAVALVWLASRVKRLTEAPSTAPSFRLGATWNYRNDDVTTPPHFVPETRRTPILALTRRCGAARDPGNSQHQSGVQAHDGSPPSHSSAKGRALTGTAPHERRPRA
jgi:hypothetical protein